MWGTSITVFPSLTGSSVLGLTSVCESSYVVDDRDFGIQEVIVDFG